MTSIQSQHRTKVQKLGRSYDARCSCGWARMAESAQEAREQIVDHLTGEAFAAGSAK